MAMMFLAERATQDELQKQQQTAAAVGLKESPRGNSFFNASRPRKDSMLVKAPTNFFNNSGPR